MLRNGCFLMIPVESHYLYSIREQASFTWRSMVCELIDNSIGAHADEVRLYWPGGKAFVIEDNGNGTDDLMQMLTLGGKRDRSSGDIGYYGVGAKLALIWLWGKSRIVSACGAHKYTVEIDWNAIAEGLSEYPSEDTIEHGSAYSLPDSGTSIRCFSERNYPKFDDLFAAISNTYTPGLESGVSIIASVNGKPRKLKPRRWPNTTKQIDDVVNAAGRDVRIRMGIVAPDEHNPYLRGFSFERSFRVIKESMLGTGDYSAARIAARITLGPDWLLSTNKDDFCEFQDELAEAIYERCKDLLQEGSEQAVSHEDQQFNRELAAIITQANRREARPNSTGNAGSIEPKSSGVKRKNAAATTDGDGSVTDQGSAKSRRCGFSVHTYNDDSATFGYYDSDANKVCLNMSNNWLKQKHQDKDAGALTAVIYGIISDHDIRKEGGRSPLLKTQIDDDFCATWGANVERVCRLEAKE